MSSYEYLPPKDALPIALADKLSDWLDRQGRIRAAYYVRVRYPDSELSAGPTEQDELFFDLRGRQPTGVARAALFIGVAHDMPKVPGYPVGFTFPPQSAIRAARSVGIEMWRSQTRDEERAGLDRLNYSFDWSPLEAPEGLASAVRQAVDGAPEVEAIYLGCERLLKDDLELVTRTRVYLDAEFTEVDRAKLIVGRVAEAARAFFKGVAVGGSILDPDVEQHSTLVYGKAPTG